MIFLKFCTFCVFYDTINEKHILKYAGEIECNIFGGGTCLFY
jgi:hypothetical protein